MKTPLSVLAINLLIHLPFSAYSQNAFYPVDLIISDHIQVVEEDYPQTYDLELRSENLENVDLVAENNLSGLIWNQMVNNAIVMYNQDCLFDPEFPLNLEKYLEPANIRGVYDLEESESFEFTEHQIKSIVFTEEWNLDASEFRLDKQVTGILPIRHYPRTIFNSYTGVEEPTGEMVLQPVAYIPIRPEKKRDLKKAKKNLVPIKKISYEFMFSDMHFLNWYDSQCSDILFDIPLVKPMNPCWSNLQVNRFRHVIIDNVFQGKVPVIDLESGVNLTDKDIAQFFGYSCVDSGKYYFGYMTQDDPDTWTDNLNTISFEEIPDFAGIKEQIYSVIFTEEWLIDPETLYMEKKILSITPVFWSTSYDGLDEGTWKKSIFFKMEMQ